MSTSETTAIVAIVVAMLTPIAIGGVKLSFLVQKHETDIGYIKSMVEEIKGDVKKLIQNWAATKGE